MLRHSHGLTYGSGPVATSPVVYLDFWASQWDSGPNGVQQYLQSLFSGLGDTSDSWSTTMTQYTDGSGNPVTFSGSVLGSSGGAAPRPRSGARRHRRTPGPARRWPPREVPPHRPGPSPAPRDGRPRRAHYSGAGSSSVIEVTQRGPGRRKAIQALALVNASYYMSQRQVRTAATEGPGAGPRRHRHLPSRRRRSSSRSVTAGAARRTRTRGCHR